MNERRIHPTTPEHKTVRNHVTCFNISASLIAVVAIALVPLLGACRSNTTTISSTVTISSTAPQDTKTATSKPIDTGTGTTFTMDWPPPNGTSLPYLTFYNDVKYTERHLWVRVEADNTVRIGFTDYGQSAVGNFQTIDMPEPGAILTRDATFGFVQGEDTMDYNLTAPVSGIVLEVNQDVLNDHDLINRSPYDMGWLILIRMSNPDELNLLLTAAEYASQCCPPCHCNT